MTEPRYDITPEAVRRYAAMFDIPLTDTEAAELSGQLAGGFAGIAALWELMSGPRTLGDLPGRPPVNAP